MMRVLLTWFKNSLMAFGVLLAAGLSLAFPSQVSACLPHSKLFIPILLGVVMFGMGLTLKFGDFLPLLKKPQEVALGMVAQFLLMPLIAVVLVKTLHLNDELALGVLLVGCCPGGTASNVITYLARGDVAFSVAMTSCSTLLAPILTPLLLWLTARHTVDVNPVDMSLSVLEVVIAPILLGCLANRYLPRIVARIKAFLPSFSTLVVIVIVMAVTAANAEKMLANWGLVCVVVALHNLLGMALGWGFGRLFRFTSAKRRTLAIEVGMQNSGLAVSLAKFHFENYPMAAVPGALFSIWHNLSGSLYAAIVKNRD